MPSPSGTGTRGRDAPVEELTVINVALAPARFRAFPDDTGIALKGDKPVAYVGPILKLLDGHVIAGLAAGTAGEECPRDIDHVRRARALVSVLFDCIFLDVGHNHIGARLGKHRGDSEADAGKRHP